MNFPTWIFEIRIVNPKMGYSSKPLITIFSIEGQLIRKYLTLLNDHINFLHMFLFNLFVESLVLSIFDFYQFLALNFTGFLDTQTLNFMVNVFYVLEYILRLSPYLTNPFFPASGDLVIRIL